MTTTNSPKVQSYNLTASNGRHIRVATMVILADGTEIRFMEKLTKAEALRAAAR